MTLTSSTSFLTRLASPPPLLFDGAMGTMIHARGVGFDQCFDELNLTNPALIADIHRAYIDAGAEVVLTNTFGANRYRLARHGLENRVGDINRAGVDLARRVILASFKNLYLAGDVGPLGVRLVPFGRVQLEQARDAFREQIAALVESGVDVLLMETFSDLYEIIEAIKAAREVSDTPVIASMTFTRDDRTLLGNSPAEVAQRLHEAGADVIGINCSGGPAQMLRILKQAHDAVPDGRFFVKPNAGLPEQVGGRIMYPAGPAYFGDYAQAFRRAGACMIGGCCGTTPEHTHAMRVALDAPVKENDDNGAILNVVEREEIAPADQPTELSQKLSAKQFIITVEMAPPRGLNTQKVLAAASMLQEAGADVINVSDSPMARMRMSPWAVANLIHEQVGVETILHFPTRGRNLLRVQGDLLAAHALNVRNLFVVMGDPTAIGDYPDAMDNYDVVPSGLVKLIKQSFNAGTDYAGSDIGQPTSFFVGCAANLTPREPEGEIKTLRRKIKAGADFALTQPIFDPQAAQTFLGQYAAAHGALPIPVVVGILPLANPRHAAFLHNELPGVSIPSEYLNRMETASDPREEGIRIAAELIGQVRPWVAGIYIMPPFGRYDVAAEIVERVK
ncbi:MAG: bifunctional homocysteine S-methyltransferase/methylenetetrahydrofolate reductase [Anaerolineales bacterium]|nr:bifunctional homocysteine S-methyltransferase/methylenetetrahydrofolate reductase [Anaerolineales bacterium]